jgi:hypothetical protein
MKSIVARQTIVGYSIPNNNEVRPTGFSCWIDPNFVVLEIQSTVTRQIISIRHFTGF